MNAEQLYEWKASWYRREIRTIQFDENITSRIAPVIKMDTEGLREVKAELERVPTSRHIGDHVRVCHDKRDAEKAYIVN